MSASTRFEIESFLGKFIQLSSCGYQSSLDLTASNGKICINFQTSLNIDGSFQQREKPARTRRRQRRKEKLGRMSSPLSDGTACNNTASVIRDALNSEIIVPESSSTTEKRYTTDVHDNTVNAFSYKLLTGRDDVEVQCGIEVTDAMCKLSMKLQMLLVRLNLCHLGNQYSILSIEKLLNISIPPKTIYHPAIINATKSFYGKHPSELSSEECEKFNWYLEHKRNSGEPVESDIIYLPSSMRNCLHCDLPT